jgi:peptide deformylase
MRLKIVDIKSPILRQKAKRVRKIDKKISKLIKDMRETLMVQKDPEGVGLAAPQIGKSLRIFVINYEKINKVFINPKIVKIYKNVPVFNSKKKDLLEGCLSVPHYYGPLTRPGKITISYLNENSKRIKETFEGFIAQIIQHEMDHLEGILFIDKIIKNDIPLYKFSGDHWEEVDLI